MNKKTLTWDYTRLADAYLKRPQYSGAVIDDVIEQTAVTSQDRLVDIGAGTGNLTTLLLERNLQVDAVEPNDSMRRHGISRTQKFGDAVTWSAGVAEDTNLPHNTYSMATFGSSFNVVEPSAALKETFTILKSGGWFMCCWNYRDLRDARQLAIDELIRRHLPDYDRGTRAEDQTHTIAESGLFEPAQRISDSIVHRIQLEDWMAAWRSHATLLRQAGKKLDVILGEIQGLFEGNVFVDIPYVTVAWLAKRREHGE